MQEPKKEDFGWVAPTEFELRASPFYKGWSLITDQQNYENALRAWEQHYRRKGQTTRLIDKAIQALFTTGTCITIDHYNTTETNRSMFHSVMCRLLTEHFKSEHRLNTTVTADVKTLTITLNDYEKRS